MPVRRSKKHQQADGGEQQGIVGQRGQELRQQDDVKQRGSKIEVR